MGLLRRFRRPSNEYPGSGELLIEQTQENGQDGLGPDLRRILVAGQQLLALINTNFHPVRTLDFVGSNAPRSIMTNL